MHLRCAPNIFTHTTICILCLILQISCSDVKASRHFFPLRRPHPNRGSIRRQQMSAPLAQKEPQRA